MTLPFASRAPALDLRDPLGELLGSLAPGELLHFDFADAVRHAGHSCPTVAGAWLMTVAALRELYSDAAPVRGEIEVTVGAPADDPSFGPIASVIAHITGAAGPSGFAGLRGHFRRRNLLQFDPHLGGVIRFRRTDTNRAVDARYSAAAVPPNPETAGLLDRVLGNGQPNADERARFAALWQARVEAIVTGPIERCVELRPA